MQRLMTMLVTLVASGAVSATPLPLSATPPAQISQLLACRGLPDAAARLACFDRESASVSQSIERKDLVIVDREAVRTARRSLFGFSIPRLGLFGNNDKEEVNQIDGLLAATSHNRDGGYVVTLQDGTVWDQIDDRSLAIEPRAGDKVVVSRATMGSFWLNIRRQPGLRVRRIN